MEFPTSGLPFFRYIQHMISLPTFRKLALAFDEAEEQPHFEKQSFRVKKKIFATLDSNKQRAVVKLSAVDQSVFSSYDNTIIYPVPNAWGKQGWTIIELKRVKASICRDALTTAYCNVAPMRLAEKYKRHE
jgi:predicted DNA-binding protein (MmcQ/YjbR family)